MDGTQFITCPRRVEGDQYKQSYDLVQHSIYYVLPLIKRGSSFWWLPRSGKTGVTPFLTHRYWNVCSCPPPVNNRFSIQTKLLWAVPCEILWKRTVSSFSFDRLRFTSPGQGSRWVSLNRQRGEKPRRQRTHRGMINDRCVDDREVNETNRLSENHQRPAFRFWMVVFALRMNAVQRLSNDGNDREEERHAHEFGVGLRLEMRTICIYHTLG